MPRVNGQCCQDEIKETNHNLWRIKFTKRKVWRRALLRLVISVAEMQGLYLLVQSRNLLKLYYVDRSWNYALFRRTTISRRFDSSADVLRLLPNLSPKDLSRVAGLGSSSDIVKRMRIANSSIGSAMNFILSTGSFRFRTLTRRGSRRLHLPWRSLGAVCLMKDSWMIRSIVRGSNGPLGSPSLYDENSLGLEPSTRDSPINNREVAVSNQEQ